MDSVLSSLIEYSCNSRTELEKSLKKRFIADSCFLFRGLEQAVRTLFKTLERVEGAEVIISPLAPAYVNSIIKESGFSPIFVDVELTSGLFDPKELEKKISDNSAYIISTSVFGLIYPFNKIEEYGIPVIELFTSGISYTNEQEIIGHRATYTVLSLEENSIVTTMGGAALLSNIASESQNIKNLFAIESDLTLSNMNSSFAIPGLEDLETLIDKQKSIKEYFKASTMQSGYYFFSHDTGALTSAFPVVLNKGLKDVQHYCKNSGVETIKGFQDTIIKHFEVKNCKNARLLAGKTLLFPLFIGMKKDSVSLISKILSTLP